MTTSTASEVNRRIAEFEGWTEIGEVAWNNPGEPKMRMVGCPPERLDRSFEIPDYMHDANAAIAAAEKFCRESDATLWIRFDASNGWHADFTAPRPELEAESSATVLATAIALALFAVLGEGS